MRTRCTGLSLSWPFVDPIINSPAGTRMKLFLKVLRASSFNSIRLGGSLIGVLAGGALVGGGTLVVGDALAGGALVAGGLLATGLAGAGMDRLGASGPTCPVAGANELVINTNSDTSRAICAPRKARAGGGI